MESGTTNKAAEEISCKVFLELNRNEVTFQRIKSDCKLSQPYD